MCLYREKHGTVLFFKVCVCVCEGGGEGGGGHRRKSAPHDTLLFNILQSFAHFKY